MDIKALVKMSVLIAFLNALYISGLEIDFVFVVVVVILFIIPFYYVYQKFYDRYEPYSFKVVKIVFSLMISCFVVYLIGKIYFMLGFSLPPFVHDILF